MNPFDQFLDSIYIDQFDPAVLSFLLHVVDLLRDSALTSEDRIAALEKLMDKLGEGNTACMDSIHIGFVYLDEDIIS